MLENCNGKLFVCASSLGSCKKRLTPVSIAAERMARLLKLNFEIRTIRKRFKSIYVYYENGDEEPVPIYCDGDKQFDMAQIYTTLRNMMFVLSFHPRYSSLRYARNEIMQSS